MLNNKLWSVVPLLVIIAILVAACGGATPAPAVEESAAAEPATEESSVGKAVAEEESATDNPAAEESNTESPNELKIAGIFGATIEEAWYFSWLQAWQRLNEKNPYGVKITVDYTENVWGADAELAMRKYAESGKYDIIWAHSSYSDQVKNLYQEYPDILWAYTGSGNEGLGGNAYWIYGHTHEPAYLCGIIAGMMTETNDIGIVAGFPFDDVNDAINGFVDGARSVNSDVDPHVTYIESWYDPPKAKEATLAQVATGADFIYAERQGPIEACQEKGCLVFGHFADVHEEAPDVVVASSLVFWDPAASFLLDEWWAHATEGKSYDAPKDPVWYGMKNGGSDISPLYQWEEELPAEVVEAVNQAKQDILDGKLEVPLKLEPLE